MVARRRTSTDTHAPATRSASSDSSTGSESSAGSGIRSTGAPFTAEEMKQKYLSRAPASSAASTVSSPHSGTPPTPKDTASPTSRSFQSRFLATGEESFLLISRKLLRFSNSFSIRERLPFFLNDVSLQFSPSNFEGRSIDIYCCPPLQVIVQRPHHLPNPLRYERRAA